MSWYSKVVWSEGMFLRPQHFQQQDRYLEGLVRLSRGHLRPYDWGVVELALDREALALGKIALTSAKGLLPDGTPFSIPDRDPPPAPLAIDASVRDSRVMLALPLRRTGMADVERGEQTDTAARYRAVAREVRDNNVDTANTSAFVEIGEPRLRLLLDTRDWSDHTCIGVARVAERRPDQKVVLDEQYIPPALDCRGVPALNGFVAELLGLLHQRGDALAERVVGGSTARAASLDLAQFMRLQSVNRFEPLFAHLTAMQNLHPESFYQIALQMAGEMATFTDKVKRRPPAFPAYDHDDLQTTFAPLMRELRRSLSLEEVDAAIQIPLEERQYGIRVGIITDREKPLLSKANFILAVRADMAADLLRARFPPQLKIGPVEIIAKLINHHLPGVGVSALPVAPREIPYRADFVYFRLDRNSEFWKQLLNSGGFAFFVGGEFPGLDMVFWAIKE
ncbi:MAG TPA: type VI secretion system baseplate subunit TssK [Candidatus Competibacter sp.]|nr:type VI secretion system baseplate subunit TssK [Candidatus Competibacteraceae bacterium]HAO33115.1 type VI secretion system baseplate subunit TssK [Candidatus Competibacteraceae bacterium]HRE54663.1 type VI secretion system baseplate subunit TssK [Candidatus Competibacter sp.]HUM92897.1 type VI secretion system baseplate subunit TssK [Candidatus Competibacter sp.]